MAEGRSRALWGPWSAWMALYANCHRDRKRPAFTASDFDPTAERTAKGPTAIPITFADLKRMRGKK